MKIGLWKRIVLALKLLLGMQVIQDVRLVLAGEIQALKDTIVRRTATIVTQQESLRDLMRVSARQVTAAAAVREELTSQLEDLEASMIKIRLPLVE